MHFYESSIITTKDGLYCQSYANEHPINAILVKPKYIPTDIIHSDAFQYRFISGKRMNRLNLWADRKKLTSYIKAFKEQYPEYVFHSDMHQGRRLFFQVPLDRIERIYFPKTGLTDMMKMPPGQMDPHLKTCHEFVGFLLNSGLELKDLGITYSTLMGHYSSKKSDINIVVYGKENYWKLMEFLKQAQHQKLRWKTEEEWLDYHKRRNRFKVFSEKDFLFLKQRIRSEGFFDDTLFVIFAVEKEDEIRSKWGSEKFVDQGIAKIRATVADNHDSTVRPGRYKVKEYKVLEGGKTGGKAVDDLTGVVFYSRDYSMLAEPGELIEARGILEKVEPKKGKPYHRLVVGYFDSYTNDRHEYIKVIL
ncbi:MAG: hypothetical protein KJ709_00905 [Nanoarchaeota archaeon]|nr:hypothetical protein [Nanoarchaeota archaeon]